MKETFNTKNYTHSVAPLYFIDFLTPLSITDDTEVLLPHVKFQLPIQLSNKWLSKEYTQETYEKLISHNKFKRKKKGF